MFNVHLFDGKSAYDTFIHYVIYCKIPINDKKSKNATYRNSHFLDNAFRKSDYTLIICLVKKMFFIEQHRNY